MFKSTLVPGLLPLCLAGLWLTIAPKLEKFSSGSNGTDNFLPPKSCTIKNRQNRYSSSQAGGNQSCIPLPPVDHRQRTYRYYTSLDLFNGELSVAELELASITSRKHANTYAGVSEQRYDSFDLYKQSTGPHIDQELCIRQLKQLNVRLDVLLKEKTHSLDLNLYRLLDTFGRVPPGVTNNDDVWLGVYTNCLELRIESPEGPPTPTRYCMASLRRKSWPQADIMSKDSAFKSGVCLPRACDSTRYRNKFELIDRLMSFNAREVDRNQTVLHDLYCLPDEDSPLRNWWRSPMVMVAIVVSGIWLAVLAYATVRYEWDFSKKAELANELEQGAWPYKIYQLLALSNNLKALFKTDRADESPRAEPVVDFNCLDGIKVICMWYVILGHVIMCFSMRINNLREIADPTSLPWIFSNMMPAFAVNAFFTITGILTCYLLLKENKSRAFMSSPVRWLMIFFNRYLRIMPMYALVVYYCKYIGKFTGAGPMWDYGISSLAPRRRCEQESWLWTLLFGANLKQPLEHCIPSAWYLANDFQFFLITPIFMIILHKNAQLGKRLLKLCIMASYLAGILSILRVEADLRPIVQFMQHGFVTYVTFLCTSYTFPHYRIGSYLIGLLLGFYLHEYEKKRQLYRFVAQEAAEISLLAEPVWPKWLLKFGSKVVVVFCILLVLGPIAGARIPLRKSLAHTVVALTIPSYHISFALVTGLYILLASTGHGNKPMNRFLSSSLWKPPARLSLCVVLVNIEVINYICQSQKQQFYLDPFSHVAINLLSLFSSYSVAAVLYVVFEAPIKGISNHLLSLLLIGGQASNK